MCFTIILLNSITEVAPHFDSSGCEISLEGDYDKTNRKQHDKATMDTTPLLMSVFGFSWWGLTDFSFLWCNARQSCRWILTFRRNKLPPFSLVKLVGLGHPSLQERRSRGSFPYPSLMSDRHLPCILQSRFLNVYTLILKTEVACSEKSVSDYKTIRCQSPGDHNLNLYSSLLLYVY
jgi:hypothetical protein